MEEVRLLRGILIALLIVLSLVLFAIGTLGQLTGTIISLSIGGVAGAIYGIVIATKAIREYYREIAEWMAKCN